MTDPLFPDTEPEMLAAELALGLLDGPELAAALEREASDVGFAELVASWRARTATWIDDLAEGQIDKANWRRIEAALGSASTPTSSGEERLQREGGTPVRHWRSLALLASAASVVLAVALAFVMTSRHIPATIHSDGPGPSGETASTAASIAQIAGRDGAPLISAAYYPDANRLVMRTADFATPAKAPELWVLDPAGKPHSLGLVEARDTITIELSPQLRQFLIDGATIAITLEDREGAPHAAPSGQIIGTARLSRL